MPGNSTSTMQGRMSPLQWPWGLSQSQTHLLLKRPPGMSAVAPVPTPIPTHALAPTLGPSLTATGQHGLQFTSEPAGVKPPGDAILQHDNGLIQIFSHPMGEPHVEGFSPTRATAASVPALFEFSTHRAPPARDSPTPMPTAVGPISSHPAAAAAGHDPPHSGSHPPSAARAASNGREAQPEALYPPIAETLDSSPQTAMHTGMPPSAETAEHSLNGTQPQKAVANGLLPSHAIPMPGQFQAPLPNGLDPQSLVLHEMGLQSGGSISRTGSGQGGGHKAHPTALRVVQEVKRMRSRALGRADDVMPGVESAQAGSQPADGEQRMVCSLPCKCCCIQIAFLAE